MQVVSGARDEDLKDEEVLQQAELLLLVARQLDLARAAQTEDTTLDFLAVGFADGATFFLPLFKRVLSLEGQHFDRGAAMERQLKHFLYLMI